MWSPESRAIASQRAKDRWADPEYRIKQSNSILNNKPRKQRR